MTPTVRSHRVTFARVDRSASTKHRASFLRALDPRAEPIRLNRFLRSRRCFPRLFRGWSREEPAGKRSSCSWRDCSRRAARALHPKSILKPPTVRARRVEGGQAEVKWRNGRGERGLGTVDWRRTKRCWDAAKPREESPRLRVGGPRCRIIEKPSPRLVPPRLPRTRSILLSFRRRNFADLAHRSREYRRVRNHVLGKADLPANRRRSTVFAGFPCNLNKALSMAPRPF